MAVSVVACSSSETETESRTSCASPGPPSLFSSAALCCPCRRRGRGLGPAVRLIGASLPRVERGREARSETGSRICVCLSEFVWLFTCVVKCSR